MACSAVSSQSVTPTEKPQTSHQKLQEMIDKVAQTVRGVLILHPSNVCLVRHEVKVKQEEKKAEKSDSEESTDSKKKYRIAVPIQIYSHGSLTTCKKHHATDEVGYCTNFGWQGTWVDVPPVGLKELPITLPIEFFMNKDGSFITHGDKIQFEFKGKHVELTVCHLESTHYIVPHEQRKQLTFANFEDQLQYCITIAESTLQNVIKEIHKHVSQGIPMPEHSEYVWYNKL